MRRCTRWRHGFQTREKAKTNPNGFLQIYFLFPLLSEMRSFLEKIQVLEIQVKSRLKVPSHPVGGLVQGDLQVGMEPICILYE
jgi:hypothetical protein